MLVLQRSAPLLSPRCKTGAIRNDAVLLFVCLSPATLAAAGAYRIQAQLTCYMHDRAYLIKHQTKSSK